MRSADRRYLPHSQYESDVTLEPCTRDSFAQVFADVQPEPVRESLWALVESTCAPQGTMIVEHTYVDRDILSCFDVQATRSFTPVERNATRVHFFDAVINRVDLEEDPERPEDRERLRARLQKHYQGFSVIRPDSPWTFGRTMIRPPRESNGQMIDGAVEAEFRVSLMGRSLTVRACPYLSQEGKVLACATAAIYMSTLPLSKKDEDNGAETTAEITQLANGLNRGYGPTIGAAGLTNEQIEQVLVKLGYDPLCLDYPTPERVSKLAAAYCDGGFAPILSLYLPPRRGTPPAPDQTAAFHVVTAVGHSVRSGFWRFVPGPPPAEFTDANESSSEWLVEEVPVTDEDLLVVHDDQQGIYLPAAVRLLRSSAHARSAPPPPNRTRHARLRFASPAHLRSGLVIAVHIPVPSVVMATIDDVIAGMQRWLRKVPPGYLEDGPLYLRPILIRSRDFKDGLVDRLGMPNEVKIYYRRLPLPLYVWLVELSYGLPEKEWGAGPAVIGEFVFDSTSSGVPSSMPLAYHLPGLMNGLFIRGWRKPRRFFREVERDVSYQPHRPPQRG